MKLNVYPLANNEQAYIVDDENSSVTGVIIDRNDYIVAEIFNPDKHPPIKLDGDFSVDEEIGPCKVMTFDKKDYLVENVHPAFSIKECIQYADSRYSDDMLDYLTQMAAHPKANTYTQDIRHFYELQEKHRQDNASRLRYRGCYNTDLMRN